MWNTFSNGSYHYQQLFFFAKKEITYWSLFKLCFYINLQTLFKKFLVLMLGLLLAW